LIDACARLSACFHPAIWLKSVANIVPGVEFGFDATILHGINDRIECAPVTALIALVGACQGPILFSEKYFFTLDAALHGCHLIMRFGIADKLFMIQQVLLPEKAFLSP
jgi:hypothetical protein